MGETRTYSPEEVVLTWGPYEITGFMDGEPIVAERDEVAVTDHAGLKGNITRIKNPNKAGKFTVTLTQVSASNDDLSAAAVADEIPTTNIVHPLHLVDHLGTTQVFAAEAWLEKIPKISRGKDLAGVEWVFRCAKMLPFVGGSIA